MVLLARSPYHSGLCRANDLRRVVNRACATWNGHLLPMQASFGIHPFNPGDEWKTILHAADHAMYCCKRGNREGDDRRIRYAADS